VGWCGWCCVGRSGAAADGVGFGGQR
jgi:hypothetical protein